MNARLKRRLLAVTAVVIVVFIVMLAVVTAGTTARSVSVAEVLAGDVTEGERVEVTGIVTDDSYSMDGTTATFAITDDDSDENASATGSTSADALTVTYDGAISATFGAGITAICTGVLGSDGTLEASELVTKCPSKYEDSSDSLTVTELLAYGDDIVSTTVKVSGTVTSDGIAGADEAVRFTLTDSTDDSTESATLDVSYDGALSDDVTAGATLVVTGSLSADGTFSAADVALGE